MSFAVPAIVLWCWAGAIAAGYSSPARSEATISTVALPGGVEGIRRALGDRAAMDGTIVGVEIARRFYGGRDARDRDLLLPQLIDWLQTCAHPGPCTDPALPAVAVPLPGPPEFWRDVVFAGNAETDTILLSIFADRRAALLYTALLSLDEDTRRWILGQPAMIGRLSEAQIGALVVAAPYLQVANGTWRLPGDGNARPVWMALAGVSSEELSTFIPAFLSAEQGLLAYLAEFAATLTPQQRAVVCGFDRPVPADRIHTARRLMNAVRVAFPSWRPDERPYWRPPTDPALFVSQLPVDASGQLRLPAGRKFWDAVFDNAHDRDVSDDRARELWRHAEPLDPVWLISRVLGGPPEAQVTRQEQVLLAARLPGTAGEDAAPSVLIVLRGHARFPELLRTLDRLGVSDRDLIAAMVGRAAILTRAAAEPHTRAAIAQWQSALMLLLHTVKRGTSSGEDVVRALGLLSGGDVPAARRGDVLRWIAAWLDYTTAEADTQEGTIGQALIERLAAWELTPARPITWEDTEYRLDFAAADRARLERVRSRAARRWLDSALAALDLADRLDGLGDTDRLVLTGAELAGRVDAIIAAARLDSPTTSDDDFGRAAREAASSARRRLSGQGRPSSPRVSDALYDLADALGAAALVETTYATSMGWAENLPLKADAVMRRHRFATQDAGEHYVDLAWSSPRIVTGADDPWHVRGGVLGLDIALARLSARRLSMKPPAGPPKLSEPARQLLMTTAVLLDRRNFTDESQRQLVSLVAGARARLDRATDPRAVESLAAEAGTSPLRASLAGWLARTDRAALGRFFSLTELVRIGLEGRPVPDDLNRWGNRETPLTGRDQCGPFPELFWERYAGRWQDGLIVYAVPDLQLALALRLAELNLPAVLVPDLMTSATHDFTISVPARYPDDWHAMIDWAAGISVHTVERYLDLLTVDGPLRVDGSRVAEH
jgi:hypothetical protein